MAAEQEFKQIYDAYYRKILLYLTRIAGENDAVDLAQDVFDKVSKGLKAFLLHPIFNGCLFSHTHPPNRVVPSYTLFSRPLKRN